MMWRLAGAAVLLMAAQAVPAAAPEATKTRPNVLVILADDLGYSDIGCFGGEIQTPNIDALAAGGLRFTQFYNTARCCPTRASLMTGLYPHQTGMGHMMFERNRPGYRGDLNRQCATIAEVLGDGGYRTYMVGKWHLTRHDQPQSPKHNWPLQRGFEKYYGLIQGYSSFFDPGIVRGNTWHSRDNDPEYKTDDYYFTTALSDNAVTFLQQHEKESPEKPFFLYAAYTAAHWPMHALEKDIAKYKGRFDAGYDKLRQERVARLRKLGLMKPEWEVAPTAENWDQVKHREWELRCMEVYAAMIDSMDQGIGKIVAELKRQGKLDDTLILFLQDNGGCAEDRGRTEPKEPPPAGIRALKPDELTTMTIPKQTRDGRPVLGGPGVMPGGPDTYISYGPGWANVSNTPFREYKHWVHEGGISTPLIAHWPNGIPQEKRNGLVSDPAHLIDVMATCVDLAGTSYPAERRGEKITPMEGVSLRPVLEGKAALERKAPIFWEHEGNRAVREGKWKLVAKEDASWELYDMETDRTEMHDLAAKHPERVKELAAKWDAWAARSNVLPLGGWKRDAADDKPRPERVELRGGESLAPEKSPRVHERPLKISVEIPQPKGDGVLVSQGGRLHGFTLFVQDGKLAFGVRRDGKLEKVVAEAPLGDAPTTVSAVLGKMGRVTLRVNGEKVAGPAAVGQLMRTPAQGVSAGLDSEDPVGDYAGEFRYAGQVGRVTVESGAGQ